MLYGMYCINQETKWKKEILHDMAKVDFNSLACGNVDNIVGSTENMTGTNDSGLYNLTFDGYGFETEKTTYAEGENVTVYYGMVGTDTDYNFGLDCDDVKLLQSYDSVKGFVFNFVMPAHDVKLSVNAQNTMVNNQKWK